MLIDTNIILRSLSGEPDAQAVAVRQRIADIRAADERATVLSATLLQVDYVLSSPATGNGWPRAEIADALRTVLAERAFAIEHAAAWQRALEIYESRSIDLDDCLMAALAEQAGTKVLSSDRDLHKLGVGEYP